MNPTAFDTKSTMHLSFLCYIFFTKFFSNKPMLEADLVAVTHCYQFLFYIFKLGDQSVDKLKFTCINDMYIYIF